MDPFGGHDLDGDVLEEASEEIEGETVSFAGDLTKEGVGEQLVDTAAGGFGQIDIIVNNAGYTWDGVIHKMTDEQFRAMLEIHTVVPFRVLRAAAPHLVRGLEAPAWVQPNLRHRGAVRHIWFPRPRLRLVSAPASGAVRLSGWLARFGPRAAAGERRERTLEDPSMRLLVLKHRRGRRAQDQVLGPGSCGFRVAGPGPGKSRSWLLRSSAKPHAKMSRRPSRAPVRNGASPSSPSRPATTSGGRAPRRRHGNGAPRRGRAAVPAR